MASPKMLELLSNDEVNLLTLEMKEKLEQQFQTKCEKIIDLEGQIQKIKADYEQKCYELDKKFIESTSRLDNESAQNEKVSAQCKKLESEFQDLKAKHASMETSFQDCQQESASLLKLKDNWNEDKLSLQHLLEKRDLEIERLNGEWKSISDRLTESTSAKNELQLKIDEITSSEVTSHYHLKRVEQEKELLSRQNAQLTEELNQKSNELIAVKKEKGHELISLRGQFELNCNENKLLKETINSLNKSENMLRERVTTLHEKLTKATEDHHSTEGQNRTELQSQTRLAELYKASSEDAEKKSEELISAVEELQKLVKDSCQKNDDLQCQIKVAEAKTAEHYKESERVRKELESANDLLAAHRGEQLNQEQLAEMCPTAALTSKFIKSGMTLTQIYAQHIQLSDEIVVVKEENRRLNEAMDSILEELNAKAPLLKRQREDYERALITISQLTKQTDQAAIEFQRLRQETDDAVRRSAHLNRDNERFRRESADLSKQVCLLLKEIEELRGRKIVMSPQKRNEKSLLVVNEDGSCNDVSSSSELISQTLVTFKDISELQEQNRKLLGVIRELSNEREKTEKEGVDEKTRDLQNELESVREELERLQDDRSRQTTMVEAIVRQRDMYRVLLAQNPEEGIPPSMLASPSLLPEQSLRENGARSVGSSPATPNRRLSIRSPRTADVHSAENTKKALLQLQEEHNEYKKEVLENNKILDDKMNELRNESSQMRANCAKLEAQLGFSGDRYEMVKQTAESRKKECDALRAKNNQLYNIMQQHERNVNNLSAELSDSKELCSKLQARLETSKSELDIAKRTEDRLTTESTSLQREQRNQSVLLNNLQQMQQSMERQAFEVRSQLHTRIEAQEREITSLRQNSHELAQNKQEAIQSIEKQLYAHQKMYDVERAKAEKLSQDLEAGRRQIDLLEHEEGNSKAKLAIVEERLARVAGGQQVTIEDTTSCGDGQVIKSLRQDLQEKKTEITSLEARLEKAKRNADHFKEVSLATEESLKQNNANNKELLDTLQSRLTEGNTREVALEQQLARTEEENRTLKTDKYKVTSEVEKQTAELRRQLVTVQTELDGSLRRMNEALSNEQIAREDLKHQMAKADEATDNYQREMMLHASAIQQLVQLKEKSKNFDAELEKATNEVSSLKQSLQGKTEGWNVVEEKLINENQQQKQRLSDIEEQNKLLHSQIETLSHQLVDMQSKQSKHVSSATKLFQSRDPVAVATLAAESSNDKSSQQLLDVIKFLRREKEIAEAKFELLQSETTRAKQKLQQLEKQFNELQENLKLERKKHEEMAEKLSKMSTLERELEMLQSVKETNKSLCEERDQLDKDVRSSNARLTQMQNDLAPLQAKNREVSAQCVTLQAERKSLKEEVDRWKERVQQMTQSPRRVDPEENRRLIAEKANLTKQVETMNKELAEQKQESSTLKGQLRSLDNNLQSAKTLASRLGKESDAKDEEIKKRKAEIEESNQTIKKLRRVGRKFKIQYEELKAEQEVEKEKESSASAAATSETVAAESTPESSKIADASALEDKARLQALNQELNRNVEENKALKTKYEDLSKKLEEANAAQTKITEELTVLRTQHEEKSKNLLETKKQLEDLTEKEKKFSKLITLAKQQIEKLRKENSEMGKERERFQEEIKRIDNERKSDAEQKTELQSKVEDLQRQLLESRIAAPTGSIQGSEIRKAANIRPISAQRVNQVTPMRVTRTARVMPEPQQEIPDTERPGPSSASQAASSSTQATVATSMPTVASITSHATAFVYPMSPARQQQQHVVSSGTPIVTHSQPAPAQQDEDPVRTEQASNTEVTDSDHAIVSSSDDQNTQDETSSTRNNPSSVVVSSASVVEASSSSTTRFIASSSSANSIAQPLNPSARAFHPAAQKRTHEQVEESNVVAPSRSATVPGSSREAQSSQATVAPLPKRQRGSPDQSSESVSAITPSTAVQPEAFDSVVTESIASGVRQPDQSQKPVTPQDVQHADVQPDQQVIEDFDEASVVAVELGVVPEEVSQSQQDYSDHVIEPMQQEVATSSVEVQPSEDVIVLSSESGGEDEDFMPDQDVEVDMDEIAEVEDLDPMEEEENVEMEDTIASTTHPEMHSLPQPQQQTYSSNLPFLVLPQEPLPRQRLASRPAPLTPGIVPSSTDDGDGIVPCTPTLIIHRPDDSYQSISSPRIPMGGSHQPIRFRFEDMPATQASLDAVPGGVGSVDNTLMDLAGATGEDSGRSVPSVPSSSSAAFTTAGSTDISDVQSSNSGNAAVSSSIQEEELEVEPEESEQTIPTSVEIATEVREASSIPTNASRGKRRFRVIGSKARGRGANSPSTSNQP